MEKTDVTKMLLLSSVLGGAPRGLPVEGRAPLPAFLCFQCRTHTLSWSPLCPDHLGQGQSTNGCSLDTDCGFLPSIDFPTPLSSNLTFLTSWHFILSPSVDPEQLVSFSLSVQSEGIQFSKRLPSLKPVGKLEGFQNLPTAEGI